MTVLVIRSIIELLLIILFLIGLRHEKFLIKFEHACWVHFKNYIRRKRMKNHEY